MSGLCGVEEEAMEATFLRYVSSVASLCATASLERFKRAQDGGMG